MYGCDAVTDWKLGSSLLWRGAADGKVYVKGATTLTATQCGFEHMANGEERYQHAATDRDDLLQRIKTLVEAKA